MEVVDALLVIGVVRITGGVHQLSNSMGVKACYGYQGQWYISCAKVGVSTILANVVSGWGPLSGVCKRSVGAALLGIVVFSRLIGF